MQDRNKNRKNSLIDFIRYLDNKLKGRERNAFEKELQKDPFAEEAAEGFESIPAKEALNDISELQGRLRKRTKKSQRIIYWRIAASIAILMVISSIFLIVRKNDSPEQIAMVDDKPKTELMPESAPLSEPARKSEQKEMQTVVIEKKTDIPVVKDERKPETEIIQTDVRPERAEYEEDQPGKAEGRAHEEYYQLERKTAISVAAPKDKSSSPGHVQGTVISSDDSMPIPGVTIIVNGTNTGVITDSGGNFNLSLPSQEITTLIASSIGMQSKKVEVTSDKPVVISLDPSVTGLSEVVVTGMGTSRTEEEENASSYVPPEPEGGKKGFEKYIHENLRWPDDGHSGEKEIVVLSFPVRTDGSIDSIRVIRSPGKPFSDEAIRLLRSGPSWKPAEENGKLIEEEVRVRIVFK